MNQGRRHWIILFSAFFVLIPSMTEVQVENDLDTFIQQMVSSIDTNGDHSLFNGKAGNALLFGNLFKRYGEKKYREIATELISDALTLIENHLTIPTHCSGFVGVLWGATFLTNEGVIDLDLDELCEELEPLIFSSSMAALEENYYDFMHGGLGAGLYFLERLQHTKRRETFLGYLSQQVLCLSEKAEKINDGISWTKDYPQNQNVINSVKYDLGLSHGLPSILMFLSKCYQAGVEIEICKNLMRGGLEFLLDNKLEGCESFFPSSVVPGARKESSRLAWCYGDLGVCISILNSARCLGMFEMIDETLEILKVVAKRRDNDSAKVYDAAICHGSGGLALIFNQLYHQEGCDFLRDAAEYWTSVTLDFADVNGTEIDYSFYFNTEGWRAESSLLTGETGVALSLLAQLDSSLTNWSSCLLIR